MRAQQQQRAEGLLPVCVPGSAEWLCALPLPPADACPPPQPTRSIYELYCDYVLKNPFHEMDQVIKSELFDAALAAAIGGANRRWGAVPAG